jgi:signal transduction histidine kinase
MLHRLRRGFDALANPHAVLRLALEDVVAMLGADSGSLALINPESGLLEIEVSVGLGTRGRRLRLPLSHGITGWVAAHGRSAIVADVANDPRYVPARAGVRSEIAVPLFDQPGGPTSRRTVLGVLNLDSNRPGAFTPPEERRLRAAATDVAALARNAWRYEEIRTQASRLDLLLAVSRELMAEDTPAGVLACAIRGATRLLGAGAAAAFELAEGDDTLTWTATYPARLYPRAATTLPVAHSLLGAAVLAREPAIIPDFRRSDPFLSRCLARAPSLGACLAVPLAAGASARGALAVFVPRGHRFPDGEINLLVTLSSVAALSLQRVELTGRLLGVEDTLRRSERLSSIGLIAAEVAHEIRNPLTVINLLIRGLTEGATADLAKARDAEVLGRKIDQLNRILDRILGLARGSEPVFHPVALNPLIEELALLLRHKLAEQKVELKIRLAPHLPGVKADRGQIEQALLNLALNALHAMPNGGRLSLVTRRAPHGAWIEVRDNGRGIPRDRLKNLFDPFLSSHDTGTGLGMAIVHKIVQAHGGSLAVRSRIGHGTRIRITLNGG